jgi:hypothetical protein
VAGRLWVGNRKLLGNSFVFRDKVFRTAKLRSLKLFCAEVNSKKNHHA